MICDSSRGVDVVVERLRRHPANGQPALALPLVDVVHHHVSTEPEVGNLGGVMEIV